MKIAFVQWKKIMFCTWLRGENLKRETECFLITAQNNAIKTNYIKVKVNDTQKNSKCTLCGDREEMVNHMCECKKTGLKRNRLGMSGQES